MWKCNFSQERLQSVWGVWDGSTEHQRGLGGSAECVRSVMCQQHVSQAVQPSQGAVHRLLQARCSFTLRRWVSLLLFCLILFSEFCLVVDFCPSVVASLQYWCSFKTTVTFILIKLQKSHYIIKYSVGPTL